MTELKHLEFNEQIDLLKSRNMKFNDETKAIETLRHINYYKIKEFAEPFCSKKNGNLDYGNIAFEYVLKRHRTDKHLRMNLFDAIENIEVSIKTNLSYILGYGTLGAYGYLKFSSWCNRKEYCKYYLYEKEKAFKKRIKNHLATTTNKEFESKSETDKKEYPPIWLLINILTFGDLIKLLELISTNKLKKLAKQYGEDITGEQLLSWLKTLNLVRNLCAHNSNLVDLELRTTPKIHNSWQNILYKDEKGYYINRLASVLCIVDKLLGQIDSNYNFRSIKVSLEKIIDNDDTYCEMLGFKNINALEELYKDKVKSRRSHKPKNKRKQNKKTKIKTKKLLTCN